MLFIYLFCHLYTDALKISFCSLINLGFLKKFVIIYLKCLISILYNNLKNMCIIIIIFKRSMPPCNGVQNDIKWSKKLKMITNLKIKNIINFDEILNLPFHHPIPACYLLKSILLAGHTRPVNFQVEILQENDILNLFTLRKYVPHTYA